MLEDELTSGGTAIRDYSEATGLGKVHQENNDFVKFSTEWIEETKKRFAAACYPVKNETIARKYKNMSETLYVLRHKMRRSRCKYGEGPK